MIGPGASAREELALVASVVSRKYARIPLASHRHARTCPDLFREYKVTYPSHATLRRSATGLR